ncbi:MAG: hypothetical protein ACWA41_04840 [Putridiphycobacter sp.]
MRLFVFVILFSAFSTFAQTKNEFVQLTNGYNRVGFYVQPDFKFQIQQHQVKLGLRYYTWDNFFEKNTIGLACGYQYVFDSKSEKQYFYTGLSTAFFKENKSTAQVYLSEFMITNGVGFKFFDNWSFYYQLGMGVLINKALIYQPEIISKYEYYNYELALGIAYHLNRKSK